MLQSAAYIFAANRIPASIKLAAMVDLFRRDHLHWSHGVRSLLLTTEIERMFISAGRAHFAHLWGMRLQRWRSPGVMIEDPASIFARVVATTSPATQESFYYSNDAWKMIQCLSGVDGTWTSVSSMAVTVNLSLSGHWRNLNVGLNWGSCGEPELLKALTVKPSLDSRSFFSFSFLKSLFS